MVSLSLFRRGRREVLTLCASVATAFIAGSHEQASAQPPRVADRAAVASKVSDLVDQVYESEVELEVMKRRSKILRLKQDVFRAAIADPSIIEFVAYGTNEIEVIGKETGSTSMTLWMGDEKQPRLLSVLVTVIKDDSVDEARRLEYGELQDMVNEMFPNSKVMLIPIADKLIVRGQARDEQDATNIMALIRQNTDDQGGQGFTGYHISDGAAAEPFPDASRLPRATVINLLKIPGEKQVLLKVRIAEVKRSALRSLGADFEFAAGDFAMASTLAGGGNILASGVFDDGFFNVTLNALTSNGVAKILAEPNLITLSGNTANFISGGEFAVPTVVGVGGAQAATTSFKGFGTQLAFTPTVLDKDRIRLNVAPTFSTLNRNNSVQGIFGTDTRSVVTTVDLREGQVLAIAGLLQEESRGEISRVPWFGSIPIINILGANRSYTRDETELMILVSPELVHPMEPEEAPTILPGMEVTEPDDLDFFIFGQIEGRANCHHRSTVWPTYRDRMHLSKKFKCDPCKDNGYYVNGPYGFSQ